MQISFMKEAISCVVVSGLFVIGWYVYVGNKVADNILTTEMKDSTSSQDQLIAKIDRINKDIIDLSKNSNTNDQVHTTDKFNLIHQEMESLHDEINILNKNSKHQQEGKAAEKFDVLYREMAVLRDKLNTLLKRTALSPDGAAIAKKEHRSEEEREQQAKAQIEQQLALYDSVAKQEGPDQQWANDAQAAVYQSFQDLGEDGIGVLEVNCHSSFCQARFFFDTADATAMQKLQNVSPWEGEAFVIANTERGEGTMYLAREGKSLPDSR